VSVSKTFNASASKLYAAFANARQRNTWLERGTLKVRSTQKSKIARFDYQDGTSRVAAYFVPKERTKTTVTVEHERLPDAESVEKMRAMWKDRLSELAKVIQS
jgi:uncharacterized protein YndB with AHSA1/START domain